MVLFLDFDDTLFNTKKFNEALARSGLNKHGITSNIFLETYDAVKVTHTSESGYYNLDEHVELLAKYGNGGAAEIKTSMFDFARKKAKDFIFSDALPFLEAHKKYAPVLITLTHGESEYQKHKIAWSGIQKYFKDTILTSGATKGECIKKYMSQHDGHEKALLLDDRGSWITEAVQKNETLIPVQMRRSDGRYHDGDLGRCAHVRDMMEFAQLLQSF